MTDDFRCRLCKEYAIVPRATRLDSRKSFNPKELERVLKEFTDGAISLSALNSTYLRAMSAFFFFFFEIESIKLRLTSFFLEYQDVQCFIDQQEIFVLIIVGYI